MYKSTEILECDFEFKCPKKWQELTVLSDPDKRFCESCTKEVYFVSNKQELEVQKKLGRCVAADVYSDELAMGITIAGGITPNGSSEVHVFGNHENANEIIVALNYLQKKRKREKDKKIDS